MRYWSGYWVRTCGGRTRRRGLRRGVLGVGDWAPQAAYESPRRRVRDEGEQVLRRVVLVVAGADALQVRRPRLRLRLLLERHVERVAHHVVDHNRAHELDVEGAHLGGEARHILGDQRHPDGRQHAVLLLEAGAVERVEVHRLDHEAVSYTHLTLPTIYSV